MRARIAGSASIAAGYRRDADGTTAIGPVVGEAPRTLLCMAERVEAWWARRQFSRGAEVPYPVGTYREAWAPFPMLIRQYHPELNAGITLTQIPPAADVLLLWQCESGHLFAATPSEQRARPGRRAPQIGVVSRVRGARQAAPGAPAGAGGYGGGAGTALGAARWGTAPTARRRTAPPLCGKTPRSPSESRS